jgi:transcription antitermination factor NusG
MEADGKMNDTDMAWFALAVTPRKEKVTARTLRAMGYEDFLPLYSVKRRWSDRIKTVEFPLFPGYVFTRFDPGLRLPILKIATVNNVVGPGNKPEPVKDSEILALQTVCQSGLQPIPCPYLTVGSKVLIHDGPLSGLEGILVRDKQTRLVLSVALLQRSVSVEIDRAWVSPLRTYRAF